MPEVAPESRSKSRWASVILVASLGINLFLIGYLAGHRAGPFRGPPPDFDHHTLEVLRQSLSPEGFKIIDADIVWLNERMYERIRSMEGHRDAVHEALLREPFDRDVFLHAMQEMHAQFGRDRDEADAKIADSISQLSSDDRKKLSELHLPHLPFLGGPPPRPPR